MDDHDQRFKGLLQEFLPEFIALFFPEWADRFDFSHTEWLEQDAFLDPPDGDRRLLDLVAKLPTTVPTDERSAECLLLVHIEVESDLSAARLRNRMLQYYAYLRRTHGLPVLPIGLFLYVGLGGIGRDVYEESVWGTKLLRFEYFSIGLPALDGVEYHSGSNILGLALSALMKWPAAKRIQFYREGLERIESSGQDEMRKYFLAECYGNYFPVSEEERRAAEEAIRQAGGNDIMNPLELRERRGEKRGLELGTKLGFELGEKRGLELGEKRGLELGEKRGLELGEKLGLELGEKRGRLEAKRETATKVLVTKFGTLPSSVLTNLAILTAEQLDDLLLAIIDAKSINELGLLSGETRSAM